MFKKFEENDNEGTPPAEERGYPQPGTAAQGDDTPASNSGDTPIRDRNDVEQKNRRRTIVYIAGPYRGENEWETTLNIRAAELAAAYYWKQGYTVICPHKNSGFMGGVVPDEEILNSYLIILERCDLVVMINGYKGSRGAIEELSHAKLHKIPIEYFETYPVSNLRRFFL